MTELLAPAGNYAKFQTAMHFGADAAYIGGKSFSLRSFADNFSESELRSAAEYAHKLGRKVYVAANIFARNADFAALDEYFRFLEKIGADAVIVSDPGAVYRIKKVAPRLPVHLSTQANTTNKYAVKFWLEQGVSRVILARELSIGEISEIKNFVPEMEIETFVHGAMCISYSGRCLLSDYLDGRSSNRGACVQACRWKYEVRALPPANGEAGWLPVEEDERGTYLFNSKDLNLISRLPELTAAGVDSFKIEGRMKSEYYLATIINAYRRALDGGVTPRLEDELCCVAHRGYTQGFADGKNASTVHYSDSQTKGECAYIANVLDWREGFAEVEMRNRFRAGDSLEILSPDENFAKAFIVEEIYDGSGERTDDAKLVQEIYKIRCPYPVRKGDFLRRRTDFSPSPERSGYKKNL